MKGNYGWEFYFSTEMINFAFLEKSEQTLKDSSSITIEKGESEESSINTSGFLDFEGLD
jgi:hypothetical protein